MTAKLGTKEDRAKALQIVRAAGMEVVETLNGAHVRAFDGEVLVLAVMKVRNNMYAFRYNPAYWNGL